MERGQFYGQNPEHFRKCFPFFSINDTFLTRIICADVVFKKNFEPRCKSIKGNHACFTIYNINLTHFIFMREKIGCMRESVRNGQNAWHSRVRVGSPVLNKFIKCTIRLETINIRTQAILWHMAYTSLHYDIIDKEMGQHVFRSNGRILKTNTSDFNSKSCISLKWQT